MELYWWWSTNPQKVRLTLEELEVPYTLKTIDLFKREQQQEAYRGISPRGRVPALKLTDGRILWESGAALTWLGQHHPSLWPDEAEQQTEALNLLFMESAAFQEHASTHFMNRVILPTIGKQPDLERIAKAKKRIRPLLSLLSDQLGTQEYLFGKLTVVDYAFAPWLPVLDLEAFPVLSDWRGRLQSRVAWARSDFRYSQSDLPRV